MVDGKLPWNELKDLMSGFKDADRFDKYVEVLQERVSWDEKYAQTGGPSPPGVTCAAAASSPGQSFGLR